MDFKIEPKVYKIGKGNEVLLLRAPSTRELNDHRSELAKVEPIEASNLVMSFLVKLGLPEDVVKDLDSYNLNSLYELALGLKKN